MSAKVIIGIGLVVFITEAFQMIREVSNRFLLRPGMDGYEDISWWNPSRSSLGRS